MATASTAISTARTTSTRMIRRRWSDRSTTLPLCKPNSSHGTCAANPPAAMRIGLSVSVVSNSGAAIRVNPSPAEESASETQSRRNDPGSRSGLAVIAAESARAVIDCQSVSLSANDRSPQPTTYLLLTRHGLLGC